MRRVVGPLKGSLDTIILTFLNKQPLTSYGCNKRLSTELGFWIASSTMWTHFNRLEQNGLIERRSHGFKLTLKGKQVLKDHLAEIERLKRFCELKGA